MYGREVLNRFVSLYAKLVLKIKREPNPFGFYERWRYYTPREDTKLLITLAEIMEDLEAPRSDPMQPKPESKWKFYVRRFGGFIVAEISLGIIAFLTAKLGVLKSNQIVLMIVIIIAIAFFKFVNEILQGKSNKEI